jgi:hypothetical protein
MLRLATAIQDVVFSFLYPSRSTSSYVVLYSTRQIKVAAGMTSWAILTLPISLG